MSEPHHQEKHTAPTLRGNLATGALAERMTAVMVGCGVLRAIPKPLVFSTWILAILEAGCREANRTPVVEPVRAVAVRLDAGSPPTDASSLLRPPCHLNAGTIMRVIPVEEYRRAHALPAEVPVDSVVDVRQNAENHRLLLVRNLADGGPPSVRIHDTLHWEVSNQVDSETPAIVRRWNWDGPLSLVAENATAATLALAVGHATRRPIVVLSNDSDTFTCNVTGGSSTETLRDCFGDRVAVTDTGGMIILHRAPDNHRTRFSERFDHCIAPQLDLCATTKMGDVAGFLTSWHCDNELLAYTRTSDVTWNRHAEHCAHLSCPGTLSRGRMGSPLNTWHLIRMRDSIANMGCESMSVDYFSLHVRVVVRRFGTPVLAMLIGSPNPDPQRWCVMPLMSGQRGLSVLSEDHALNLLLHATVHTSTIGAFDVQHHNGSGRVVFEADSETARLVP